MNLFLETVAFSDYFGEYCKAVMTDHFCYMINEVTPNSSCNSFKQSITFQSQGSDKESSDEEMTLIKRCDHGSVTHDIRSCIEKQKKTRFISSGWNTGLEILKAPDHKSQFKISIDENINVPTSKQEPGIRTSFQEFRDQMELEKALVASEEITGQNGSSTNFLASHHEETYL